MSNQENKSYGSSKKIGKEGGRDRRGTRSGSGNKGGPKTSSKSLNSDEAVPMLKYGPYNNFIVFKERLKTACMEKYGDLARLIELEEYWEPDAIDRATDYANAGTDEYVKTALVHAIKERATTIAKMRANRANMFAYMMSKLSKESIDELKRHDSFANIDEKVDPLLLWKTIKELHMVATSSKVTQVVKRKAREEYQSCKQGAFESLVDFKARFDSRYDAYKDQGNVELSEEDVAMDFLESLDRARYSDFIVETINDIAKGVMAPPKDVNQVYVLANTRLVVKRGTGALNVGASYATVEASRAQKSKNSGSKGKKGGASTGTKGKLSSSDGDKVKTDSTNNNKNNIEKKKKNLEDVVCFNCGKKGHFARDCPEGDDDASEADDLVGMTQYDGECLATLDYGECLVASSGDAVKYHEVILDSGSQVNIIHPRFLRDVREGHGGCKGLFGSKTNLTKVGMLEGFFECLGSDDTRVSVLSQADVEDTYDVTYEPGRSYTVHMADRDLKFVRRNKLYVADFSDWMDPDYEECNALLSLLTVEEKEHMYTRKEIKHALQAKEFIKNAGYPSRNEAIHLIRDGNINNVPVGVDDVNRYYDIYGPMVEQVRGKSTTKKVRFIGDETDSGLKEQRKIQKLTSDVMYLMKLPFLVSIASPLELMISSTLASQTMTSLGQALQVQINLLRSRGFDTNLVIVDPLKSLKNLEGSFPGVAIDATGAGDHLPKVDAKIRRIKENARSILAGLPYSLPKNRVKDLVTYVVNRMNTRRTTALSDNVCPRTKFTGKKIDYEREFLLGFGDYVEAYDPKVTSNSMQGRTEPCIALYPAANVSGSWILWNMRTDTYVRRTHWMKMRTTREVIDAMNALSGNTRIRAADAPAQPTESTPPQDAAVETVVPLGEPAVPTLTMEEAEIESADLVTPDLSPMGNPDGGAYDEDVPPISSISEEVIPSAAVPVRRGERARTVKRDMNFEYSLTQLSVKQGLARHGKFAKRAIKKEFIQLFKKKAVLKPVLRANLSGKQRRKIIRSSMFLKEKFDGMGKFEKLKGRLVADGRMQDRSLYADKHSPTAKLESILTELAMAAKERKHMTKVDIAGAYLNALIGDGDDIYMELNKDVTMVLVEAMPALKRFVEPSGKLLAKIMKAMYGLIQSAALWYDALTTFLKLLGFVPNSIDNCVLNMRSGERDITIILYVDDILILSIKEADIKWLIDALMHEYGELTIESGDRLTYLGMVLDIKANGEIKMRMDGYVDGVLASFPEYESIRKSTTPATINLFKPGNGELLCERDKKRFHTTTARLLYLSKRTRPDIQLPVLYLCTRVKHPTTDDDCKLFKILGYLKMTRNKARTISPKGDLSRIVAYVDASFASHPDGKGHTGLVIKWGAVTLGTISRKQKIATKSSTEAELVGLTDVLSEVERTNDYMQEQGMNLDVPIVYQDNMSTITLVTNERSGNIRTRHLSARRAIAYESCSVLRTVSIRYIRTAEMLADVLTKPLGGRLFHKFADDLLGRLQNKKDYDTVHAGATGVR